MLGELYQWQQLTRHCYRLWLAELTRWKLGGPLMAEQLGTEKAPRTHGHWLMGCGARTRAY